MCVSSNTSTDVVTVSFTRYRRQECNFFAFFSCVLIKSHSLALALRIKLKHTASLQNESNLVFSYLRLSSTLTEIVHKRDLRRVSGSFNSYHLM